MLDANKRGMFHMYKEAATKRRREDPHLPVFWLIDKAPTVALKISAMRELLLLTYGLSGEEADRMTRPSKTWLFVSWKDVRMQVVHLVSGGHRKDVDRVHLSLLLSVLKTHDEDAPLGERGERWRRDAFSLPSKTPLVDLLRPALDNHGFLWEMKKNAPFDEDVSLPSSSIGLLDAERQQIEVAASHLHNISSRASSSSTELLHSSSDEISSDEDSPTVAG